MSESKRNPDDPSTGSKPRKRRWGLRWSMRVMLVFISLVCGLFAWLGHVWHLGQVHEEVGTAIEIAYGNKDRMQGLTNVQWKLSQHLKLQSTRGGGLTSIIESKVKHSPQWMQTTGFDRFWQRIESIHLLAEMPPAANDVAVAQISRLDHVGALTIGGYNFSGEDLATMVGSIRVDRLHASHASLRQGPMPWLRHTRLKELNLSFTQFSDAAVDDLPTTLTRLELEQTQLTSDGMARLARLKNLEVLILRNVDADEATYQALKKKLPDCWIDWDPLETPEQKRQRRLNARRERRLEYEREHGITAGND